MPKSPEMPSFEGEEKKSVEKMGPNEIEAELEEREIEIPPRFIFHKIEDQRDILRRVRNGEIMPGQHNWWRWEKTK